MVVAFTDAASFERGGNPGTTTEGTPGTSGDFLVGLISAYSSLGVGTNPYDEATGDWTDHTPSPLAADGTKINAYLLTQLFGAGTDSSYKFAPTGGDDYVLGGMLAFSGVDHLGDVQVMTRSIAGVSAHATPEFDVTSDDSMAVMMCVGWDNTIPSSFTGWTERTTSDSGYNRIFTMPVDAGHYSSQSGSTDATAWLFAVVVLEAAEPGDPTVPGAPTSFTAASNRTTRATLTWVASSSDGGSAITGYLVERAPDVSGSPGTYSTITTTGVVLTYEDTGLTDGTTYWYRVSAVNAIGTSSPATAASATPTTHPAIVGTAFEIGTSLGSANAQPLPTGAATGDLVGYLIGNDNTSTTTLAVSTGWTLLSAQVQGSNVIKGCWAFRVLTGTTGDNILAVTGAAQDYAIVGFRIPAGEHGVVTPSTDIPIGNFASTSNGNTNPPSLNAGSSKNWLWLAGAVVDLTTGNTITAAPTNYTMSENRVSASSTSSVATAIAYRRGLTGSTEDPGTFTNTSRPYIGWTVAIPPPGVVTLAVPFISNTNVLYAPTVHAGAVSLAAPFISSSSALYAPVVTQGQSVSPPYIAATSQLFAPTVVPGAVSLQVPFLASTSVLHAPSVTGPLQTLTAPFIASAAQLFPPTVVPPAQSLSAPFLASTSQLFPPAVIGPLQTLLAPFIASVAALYPPTVVPGVRQLIAPFIASTSVLFAPTVIAPRQTLVAPFIASSSVLYPPALHQGAVQLGAPYIASTSELFPPSVSTGGLSLIVPFIPSTSQLFAPTLVPDQFLSPPFIASSNALHPPAITVGSISISAPFIPSTSVLYAPAVVPGIVHLGAPFISSTSALFAPSVTVGRVDLAPPFIASTSVLYAPVVIGQQVLFVPFLASTSVMFTPTVVDRSARLLGFWGINAGIG